MGQICSNCEKKIAFYEKFIWVNIGGKQHAFCSEDCAQVYSGKKAKNPDLKSGVSLSKLSESSSDSARIAVQSARIVNGYGSSLQVIGVALGLLTVVGGFILSHTTGSSAFAWIGAVFGALEVSIFTVQGALFRMLANYVIARLEQ